MRKFSKFLLIVVLAVFLTGCNAINEYLPEDNPFSPIATDSAEPVVTLPPDVDISDDSKNTDNSDKKDIQGELKVSFLDVGQADSIFIEMPDNKTMLIDAGNNNDWQTVSDFISAEGYDKIDYLVGTHPHEDHIGGLDKIIDNFQIGELFMPDATNTTKTFEDVLDAAESKNLEITVPKSGDYIVDEGNLTATVIAPNSADYKDFNDYSIVIKLIYGDTSFLFQGDAESLSEQEILDAGFDVSSDVIKLGHHGSSTSSSADYLDAADAEYAVIMCGKDNSYGHPHEETMQKLQERNIEVLRTDEQGTITIRSDGTKIML